MVEKKRADWDQMDVLRHKDHTTSSRGLQQWGEQGGSDWSEGIHEGGPTHNYGEGSMGTAERQGRIGGLAKWAREGKKGPYTDERQEEPK